MEADFFLLVNLLKHIYVPELNKRIADKIPYQWIYKESHKYLFSSYKMFFS